MKTDFKNQIKKLMKQKKISVPKLARAVDVANQTIYNYLSGRTDIAASTVEKMLDFLNQIKD